MFERFGFSKKGIISVAVILFLGLILILSTGFRTTHIEYEGNTRFSDEEMTTYIFGGKYNVNTLIYYFFKRNKDKVAIPFIQDYDVDVVWPNKLKVTVYEKSIIGYIRYMGYNLYFDKDGIVVDSSKDTLMGIPEVIKLDYSNVVLHSKLDVENDKVFDILLNLTQLCQNYSIQVSKVYISKALDVTMYVGDVEIMLGNYNYMTERIYGLSQVIGQMQGMPGVVDMQNYTEDSTSIIFKKKDIEK